MNRPETGPIQLGDDWPGTFIRGDDSFFYATCLSVAIEYFEGRNLGNTFEATVLTPLTELRDILVLSFTGHTDHKTKVQKGKWEFLDG